MNELKLLNNQELLLLTITSARLTCSIIFYNELKKRCNKLINKFTYSLYKKDLYKIKHRLYQLNINNYIYYPKYSLITILI